MKDTITLPRELVEQCLVACGTNRWYLAAEILQAALDAPEDDEWCRCGKAECAYCHATAKRPDAPAPKVELWTDADADAARLALELECLLNDTADMSIVSKWWASSMEALDLHRARMSAKPNTLGKLDAMERLLIARQQPAPTAEPPRPLFEVAIAERKWRSLQDDGYTMKHIAFEGRGKAGTIDAWGKVLWTEWPKPTAEPQPPVLTKAQARAILDMALDLEKTGRIVSLSEGQDRSDYVARNRNIQCALEDYLRNLTEPPVHGIKEGS